VEKIRLFFLKETIEGDMKRMNAYVVAMGWEVPMEVPSPLGPSPVLITSTDSSAAISPDTF